MIEYECPTCRIPLRIPESAMGRGGTCNHCREHFNLPSLWSYRFGQAWAFVRRNAWPATVWLVALPLNIVGHLIKVNTPPDDLAELSEADRLMVMEARKQTKIQRANRSDTSCCLGCIVILLILMFTGALGPFLAIIGIGGLAASQ